MLLNKNLIAWKILSHIFTHYFLELFFNYYLTNKVINIQFFIFKKNPHLFVFSQYSLGYRRRKVVVGFGVEKRGEVMYRFLKTQFSISTFSTFCDYQNKCFTQKIKRYWQKMKIRFEFIKKYLRKDLFLFKIHVFMCSCVSCSCFSNIQVLLTIAWI